jgi:hypothetical protein
MREIVELVGFCGACVALWYVMRGPAPPGGNWE